ncbi:hypothetical protein BGZ73_008532 [Actinomortierella ambigua]|nr:hypothetical protein BGZ73_008532 [Actinomortierella ambigua]
MQLKGLFIAAVAVAAANAQTFEKNKCTECVFKTISTNAACSKLPAADLTSVNSLFANPEVNQTQVTALIQNQGIKTCLCDWVAADASTASCAAGSPAACDAAQSKAVKDSLAALNKDVIKCAAAPGASPSAPGGNTTTPTNKTSPGTPTPTKSGASAINIPYALSMALVGAVAFFGF